MARQLFRGDAGVRGPKGAASPWHGADTPSWAGRSAGLVERGSGRIMGVRAR